MTARQKRILIAIALVSVIVAGGRFGLIKSYEYALHAHDKGDYATALPIVYGNALFNDTAACGLLGTMYLFGHGVAKSGGKAEYWLTKAASRDSVEAESLLGLMYATGQGVPIDREKARMWLTKAASAGDVESQALLRQLYQGKKI